MQDQTNTSNGFFQQVHSWLAQPFQSNGSALRWVLFLGLVIVAIGFWNFILIDLSREIRAEV